MIQLNAQAPSFTLPSTRGTHVSLDALRGKKVVLYFYPRDDTPGCTVEACDFRDSMARLSGHGVVVLGVSRDSLAAHAKFRSKYSLPFDLLTDAENTVAKFYGAYGKKLMYGKSVLGTIRSTFLIDERGKIAALWSPVKVSGHVDAVIAAIEGSVSAKPATKASAAKPVASKSRAPISTRAKAKATTPSAPVAKKPAASRLVARPTATAPRNSRQSTAKPAPTAQRAKKKAVAK